MKNLILIVLLLMLVTSCGSHVECGTVTYKGQELYSPRKSTRVHMRNILYVQYEGREVTKNVDIRTYEKHKVGDKVCFKELNEENVYWIFGTMAVLFVGLGILLYKN